MFGVSTIKKEKQNKTKGTVVSTKNIKQKGCFHYITYINKNNNVIKIIIIYTVIYDITELLHFISVRVGNSWTVTMNKTFKNITTK